MRFSVEQAKAVAELLATDSRFGMFMEALGDYGEVLIQRVLYEDEPYAAAAYRGMARAVTEILQAVDGARKTVEQAQEKT